MSSIALCACCQSETTLPLPARCPACQGDPHLVGRYTLVARIGQGSFGTTFRALDAGGEVVAIKELLVRNLDSFKTEELFSREAEVLRCLEHPGIPHFIEHFSAGVGRQTGFYLVTEFVAGPTLKEELSARRPTEEGVVAILSEIAQILQYLHDLRPAVVHRDLKPANIMRGADGRLMLIDFGAVKSIAKDQSEGGSTVAGTFGYMAPELFAGIAEPASDVYALGVIAVELLSGRGPQALTDDQNRLQWQQAVSGISPGLHHILSRVLAPNRRDRPADGRALAALFDDLRAGRLDHVNVRPAVVPEPGLAPGDLLKGSLAALGRGEFSKAIEALGRLQQPLTVPERPLGPPPGPTPRELPSRFAKRAAAGAHLGRTMGIIFFLVGLFVVGLGLVGNSVPSSTTDDPFPGVLVAGFGAVFALPGAIVFGLSRRRIRRLAAVWRGGETTVGVVTDLGKDRSMSVNGRNPYAISFSFMAGDRPVEARIVRWSRGPLNVGSEAHVIYDSTTPTVCLLYPFPETD